MRIRISSDWHSEFWGSEKIKEVLDTKVLPPLDTDKDSILLIAGDVGSMKRPFTFVGAMDHVCPRFRHVLWVLGNHEYYGTSLRDGAVEIHRRVKHHKNLIVDNFEKIPFAPLGGKTRNDIVMATLWTDYNGENNYYMRVAERSMADFKHIGGFDEHLASAKDYLSVHRTMVEQMESILKLGDIVMTHHLPSPKSIDPQYHGSPLNPAFCSDLEYLILEKKPALWVCGHTHTNHDYVLGDTRIVCNPFGYPGENPDYVPDLVLEA